MVKKISEKTLRKDKKPAKPAKKEVQDAARKKLMDINEC
jgi:hypothetical protein